MFICKCDHIGLKVLHSNNFNLNQFFLWSYVFSLLMRINSKCSFICFYPNPFCDRFYQLMSNILMHLFIVVHCLNVESCVALYVFFFTLNTMNDKQNNWNIVVVGNISKGYGLNNGKEWVRRKKKKEVNVKLV